MASVEHKRLAEYIKNVHVALRVSARKVGAGEAWDAHCQKKEVLKLYAESMYQLATKHWEGCDNELASTNSRIKWVVNHSLEYFLGGGRRKELLKELRRSKSVHQVERSPESEMLVDDSVSEKVKLLDVGSCYNPFKVYPLFTVVPVDLMPALDDVIEADFLKLKVEGDQLDVNETNGRKSLQVIPKSYFDVVVFSLFLEYLPSCQQRHLCCKKAYDALKPEGLLFIITPDSRHASANSTLMRNWRISLALMGFTRIYYEKLLHIHCMAYRKNCSQIVSQDWALKILKLQESLSVVDDESYLINLMKIPQDNTEYKSENSDLRKCDRTNEENLTLADTFTELPLCIMEES